MDHARKKTNKTVLLVSAIGSSKSVLTFKSVWKQVESSKQSTVLIKLFEFQYLIITTLHDKNAKTCLID